jgi:hypothetical protein
MREVTRFKQPLRKGQLVLVEVLDGWLVARFAAWGTNTDRKLKTGFWTRNDPRRIIDISTFYLGIISIYTVITAINGTWDWIPTAILYTGIAIALYFLARGLFPTYVPDLIGGSHTTAPAAVTTAKNISSSITSNMTGITVIS